MVKLKWKVAEAPTGRYRSFQKRGWPGATYVGTTRVAVMLQCEDDYAPYRVRSNDHKPLTVYVAQHYIMESTPDKRWSFKWRKLVAHATTLEEAKALATKAIGAHPEFWPPEFRNKETAT